MPLTRLVYANRKMPDCNLQEVVSILDAARRRHSAEQITGLLCFTNAHFLQCAEGTRTAVNDAYRRILRDHQRTDVVLLQYHDVGDNREQAVRH